MERVDEGTALLVREEEMGCCFVIIVIVGVPLEVRLEEMVPCLLDGRDTVFTSDFVFVSKEVIFGCFAGLTSSSLVTTATVFRTLGCADWVPASKDFLSVVIYVYWKSLLSSIGMSLTSYRPSSSSKALFMGEFSI